MAFKEVKWLGDSLKEVQGWPSGAQDSAGLTLTAVQYGAYPEGCEPLPDIGSNVHAIRTRQGKEQYRIIWLAKMEDYVYVLHAFHKKSKSGIATPKADKDLAKDRLKTLQQQKRKKG